MIFYSKNIKITYVDEKSFIKITNTPPPKCYLCVIDSLQTQYTHLLRMQLSYT